MKSEAYWMQCALVLAEKAREANEIPVGAVVVRDDAIIGEGFNQTITRHDPTAHAEVMALRDAAAREENYRLSGADLYVTIEPCSMCAGALVHARIKRLVYGALEPRAGAVISSIEVLSNPALNHKVAVLGGICDAQAGQLMADFFKAKRG